MHAISSHRGNRHTHKPTQPQTNRQDRLQYTAPQLARSVNIAWAKLERAAITATAIICQWRRRLSASIKAGNGHFEHFSDLDITLHVITTFAVVGDDWTVAN